MPGFLVDEDLPRSLCRVLENAGFRARDVRAIDLRGATDDEVLARAVSEGLTVLTADVDFGNTLRFPPSTHLGIVVARFPNTMSVQNLNKAILSGLLALEDRLLVGCVVILEPGRVRIRPPPRPSHAG